MRGRARVYRVFSKGLGAGFRLVPLVGSKRLDETSQFCSQMRTVLDHPSEFGALLAIALVLTLELGHRVAAFTRISEDPDRKVQAADISDGLFILASLLLGFTMALVSPRYIERRSLLVEEATSIGTTYLGASTLPQHYREHAQQLLREYVDARLDLGAAALDAARFAEASNRSKRIQNELWIEATTISQTDRSALTALYLRSLNETIDLHEKRIAAFENRLPWSVWLLITAVCLIAVFARGLTLTGRRLWLTPILIPITLAIVVWLIADLDTPFSGLIRLDQRPMQRLKATLGTEPPPSHPDSKRPSKSRVRKHKSPARRNALAFPLRRPALTGPTTSVTRTVVEELVAGGHRGQRPTTSQNCLFQRIIIESVGRDIRS